MTAAELIAELEKLAPDTLVVIDTEHHGWWSLDLPNGLQDKWVKPSGGDYESVDEGTEGAVRAVRIW